MARPFPLRRVASGAAAGLLAGVVMHMLLVGTAALGPIAAAIPLDDASSVAAAQVVQSFLLGMAFAALPVTGGWPRGLAWGLAYGAGVFLVLDLLVIGVWAGVPIAAYDAWPLAVLGRLLWGAVLGVVFVGLMLALFRARGVRGAPA